ncbi:nSTAND1 domain-containing NTPase [Nonomuraea sp. NPDC001699]
MEFRSSALKGSGGHRDAHRLLRPLRRLPELAPALARPLVVGPMTAAQLRQAVEKSAHARAAHTRGGAGGAHSGGLGSDLCRGRRLPHGLSDPGGVLPLMSHTLLTTWKHRAGQQLTLASHQATGGVSRSLAHTADAGPGRVGPADRARRMLTRPARSSTSSSRTGRCPWTATLWTTTRTARPSSQSLLRALANLTLELAGNDPGVVDRSRARLKSRARWQVALVRCTPPATTPSSSARGWDDLIGGHPAGRGTFAGSVPGVDDLVEMGSGRPRPSMGRMRSA